MDELNLVEILMELVADGQRDVRIDVREDDLARVAGGTALDLWRLAAALRTGAEPVWPKPTSRDALWLRLRVALAAVLGLAPDDVELETPLGAGRRGGARAYEPGAAARLDALTWQIETLGSDDEETRDRALGSLTLADLTAWEERVAARVAAASGSAEERDRALERDGVYASYPRICEGYLARAYATRREPDGREALRRLVYLVWCSGARPAFLTGVAELPDEMFDAVASELDDQCQRGALDPELRWMLAWYHAAAPEVFGRFHDYHALQRHLAGGSAEEWRRAAPRPEDFRGRGQMGRYWEAVVRKG